MGAPMLAQRNYYEGEQQLRRAAYLLRDMQRMGSGWLRYFSTVDEYQRARRGSKRRRG